MFNWKRGRLKNARIVAFDCRGCTGEDHRFLWIGDVVGFRPNRLTSESAIVKIIKRAGDPTDIREKELGFEYPVAEDTALQHVSAGLFFYYK